MIDGVLGEASIGRKTVGAVTFLRLAVIQARRVHAHAAALALAAPGVDFHGDALADLELVDVRPERRHRPHIFVPRREVLVEGQAALNAGRRSPMDDFEVGCANRNGIDANQHFGAPRHRCRLFA
jgi:hypothetical protein